MTRTSLFVAVLFTVACSQPMMMVHDSGTPHNPGDPITEIGALEGKVIIIAWPGCTGPARSWATRWSSTVIPTSISTIRIAGSSIISATTASGARISRS